MEAFCWKYLWGHFIFSKGPKLKNLEADLSKLKINGHPDPRRLYADMKTGMAIYDENGKELQKYNFFDQ
jgi:hypothetical protein